MRYIILILLNTSIIFADDRTLYTNLMQFEKRTTNPGAAPVGYVSMFFDGLFKYIDNTGALYTLGGSGGVGDVQGPNGSTTGNVAIYASSTGKVIANSTLASGKILTKDTNFTGARKVVLAEGLTKLVTETSYKIPDTVCSTGWILKSNGLDMVCAEDNNSGTGGGGGGGTGDVTGPTGASTDNVPSFSNNTGKALKDSGVKALDIVTKSTPFKAANNVVLTGGVDRTVIETAYTLPRTVCPNGQVFKSDGVDMVCQGDLSGVGTGDVVGSTISLIDNLPKYMDTSGKIIGDSGLAVSKIPAMVTPGVAGNLIQTATSSRDLSDSTIAVVDVVQRDAPFSEANRVVIAEGANKKIKETAYKVPAADGAKGEYLQTDGLGSVTWKSAGNVEGVAVSTSDYISVFDGTTGKQIKQGLHLDSDLVTGPAGATADGDVALFADTSGRKLKKSSLVIGNVVQSSASSTGDKELVVFDSTTGKIIKGGTGFTAEGGVLSAVDEGDFIIKKTGFPTQGYSRGIIKFSNNTDTAEGINFGIKDAQISSYSLTLPTIGPATSNRLLESDSTGQLGWIDTPKGDVIGPGASIINNIATYDVISGKRIKDSGRAISDVPTMPSNGASGNFLTATNKVISDSGVALTSIPSMEFNGVAGNLVQTAANDKKLSDSGIPITSVVTGSTTTFSTSNRLTITTGTSNVLGILGYSIPVSVCPTGYALESDGTDYVCTLGKIGDVIGPSSSVQYNVPQFSDASGKVITDSSLPVKNIITKTTAFTEAERIVKTTGANKSLGETPFKIPVAVCADGHTLKSNGVDYVCSANEIGDVVGPATAIEHNIAQFEGATGKLISDSLFPVANIVSKATKFTEADRVIISAGDTRAATETGYRIPTVICPKGYVLKSDGTDFKCTVSGDIASWIPDNPEKYEVNALVRRNRDLYICKIAHFSTPDFAMDLSLARWEQVSPSELASGVLTGGTLTIGPGPKQVTIQKGVGLIVNPYDYPGQRTFQRVDIPQTVLDILLGANKDFHIIQDALGVISATLGIVGPIELKDNILLGQGVTDSAGNILLLDELSWSSGLVSSQLQNLMATLGNINATGNYIGPVLTQLKTNITSGNIHSIGSNTGNPRLSDIVSIPAQNPMTFRYATSLEEDTTIVSTFDADTFEPGGLGVKGAVANGKYTIQRIYMSTTGAKFIQYGQEEYDSLPLAKAGANTAGVVVNPTFQKRQIFLELGYVIMQKGAANFDNAAVTYINNCGMFGCGGPSTSIPTPINGDVFGPASSGNGQIALFDGSSGKAIKDSGVNISKLLRAPIQASVTVGNIVGFDDITGTTSQDTGVAVSSVLTKPTGFTAANRVVISTTNRGVAETKYAIPPDACGDGYTLVSNGTNYVCSTDKAGDVRGPMTSTDGRVAVFDGSLGKTIKNGTKLEADLVTGPSSATPTNLASYSGATGKIIQDSGLLTSEIPTMPNNGVAGSLVVTSANSKVLSNSSISAIEVVTMAATGTVGNLLHSSTNARGAADSGLKTIDVIRKSTNFTNPFNLVLSLNTTTREVTESKYTVPESDGTVNQVLTTNGAGVATWKTPATPLKDAFSAYGYEGNASSNLASIYFTNTRPASSNACFTVVNNSTTGFEVTANKSCIMMFSFEAGNSDSLVDAGYVLNPTAAELDGPFTAIPAEKKLCTSTVSGLEEHSSSCSFFWISTAGDKFYIQAPVGYTYAYPSRFATTIVGFEGISSGGSGGGDVPGAWVDGTGQPGGTCSGRLLDGGTLCGVELSLTRPGPANVADGTTCTLPLSCASKQPLYFYGSNTSGNMVLWLINGRTVTCVTGCAALNTYGTTVFPL